ncbi:hypothetical protein PR202_gb29597 [Eleusine coracana subsp. coracana]|uniref:Uncharacterized protein n=1 Tax=Eleusine coracana subsp. coracana TaxID=191504 RepID=A0AAV5G0V0_ELECO|nr:hypothetical protein PR202_gb29597 [Eleusine coracana subsp. coracana]
MEPRFWRGRRHHGTALLLFLALVHRLNCLAFLASCAPVLLLTAFLLGVILVHSDMPIVYDDEEQGEDVDRHHLYKKIRRRHDHDHIIISSSSEESSCSSEQEEDMEMMMMEVVAEHEQEAVAWTADDERSIQSIGSLELERDARLGEAHVQAQQQQQPPAEPHRPRDPRLSPFFPHTPAVQQPLLP